MKFRHRLEQHIVHKLKKSERERIIRDGLLRKRRESCYIGQILGIKGCIGFAHKFLLQICRFR